MDVPVTIATLPSNVGMSSLLMCKYVMAAVDLSKTIEVVLVGQVGQKHTRPVFLSA